MRIVWINKARWKKPGPIVYMGLLNALGFAEGGWQTDYFVSGDRETDIDADLTNFYGLAPHPRLDIHAIAGTRGRSRAVYRASLDHVSSLAKTDEVLVLTRELGVLPALVKLKRQCPNVRVWHEVHDFYGSVRHLPKRSFTDYRRMLAERFTLPHVDGLVCLTEFQKALYQQFMPDLPMISQPLGCLSFDEPDDNLLAQRRQRRRVAYVGHLHSYKGLSLIEALAAQLQQNDIEIVCYGGHDAQVRELRKKAEDRGLNGCLQFHPFLSPTALHEILHQSTSLGIVPLQDTYYSRYLTCPVKALDLMSHGLPVVGSALPSVEEVLKGAGCLNPPDDPVSFAGSIKEILDDEARYRALSLSSSNRAKDIRWVNRARSIMRSVEW